MTPVRLRHIDPHGARAALVPHLFLRRKVWARASENTVEIFHDAGASRRIRAARRIAANCGAC